MSEQLSFWGYDDDGRSTNSGRRLVYFVECGNFVKIGFTTRDVGERLVELECGNPDNLKVIGTMAVGEDDDDRRLHRRFALFHHRKEWFHKTPELLRSIHNLLHKVPTNTVHISLPDWVWDGQDFVLPFDCPCCHRFLVTAVLHLKHSGIPGRTVADKYCTCLKCKGQFLMTFTVGAA